MREEIGDRGERLGVYIGGVGCAYICLYIWLRRTSYTPLFLSSCPLNHRPLSKRRQENDGLSEALRTLRSHPSFISFLLKRHNHGILRRHLHSTTARQLHMCNLPRCIQRCRGDEMRTLFLRRMCTCLSAQQDVSNLPY